MAHNISGTVGSLSGVVVTAGGKTATTVAGSYTLSAVPDGLVYVTPAKAGYVFTPPFQCFILGGDVSGVNFTPAATSSALYQTYFHLRCKNTSATVQATFSPDLQVVGWDMVPPYGEPITIPRELSDYSTNDWLVGFKQVVKITFTAPGLKYIPGAGGYSSLEAVMNGLGAGYTLEYNIIDASAGGTNWVACELKKYSRANFKGKNVATVVNLELVSKSAQVSSAFPVS